MWAGAGVWWRVFVETILQDEAVIRGNFRENFYKIWKGEAGGGMRGILASAWGEGKILKIIGGFSACKKFPKREKT